MDGPIRTPITIEPGPLTRIKRQEIEAAVAELVPQGRNGVFLAVFDGNGPKVTWAQRLGANWVLSGSASSTWGGKVSGRVEIVGSW